MNTSHVLTLETFITESIDFSHSNEYYDLKKECLELQLESLNYTRESINILNTSICESSNSSKTSNLKTTISNKITSLLNTIIKALKIFLKNIVNIFTNKQNKQIENLEKAAKESEKKINDLINDGENKDVELNKLKSEIDECIEKIKKEEKLSSFFRTLSLDRDIQIRFRDIKIEKMTKDNEISNLHKKILGLMDSHKNNKEDAQNILNMIKSVLDEKISIQGIPSFIVNIDTYLDKTRDIFHINKNSKNVDIVSLFVRNYASTGTKSKQKLNALINSVLSLKNDIEKSMDEQTDGNFSIDAIEKTNKILDDYFPDNMFSYNNDPESHDDRSKNIIKENSELFAKFISVITELSSVFKSAIGEYISYTKDIIDARKWALQMEFNILNIIRRIEMNK